MSAPPDVQLEYAFTITLEFGDIETLPDLTRGFARGALYLKGGEVSGPRLNGRVLGGSGGDWAEFRPDGTVATDARYMIEADDGTHILMRNRGFLWGRTPDVMPRMREWMFGDGPQVDDSEFYLRAAPSFEVGPGPHDWLTRHVIVGIGSPPAPRQHVPLPRHPLTMDYERYLEDFNRNDERAMVERWFTEDLVVEVPGLVIRGREDWVGFLEHSHAGGVHETLRPVEVLQADDRILAEVDITFVTADGRPDFPLAPLPPGVETTFKFFAVYHLRGEQIAHLKLGFWPEPLS